jgi:hypothetical protein
MINNYNKFYLGDEYIIDLPKNNGCCLSGKHHCVIIKRFGSTIQVVPISTNRDNLHYGELPIDVGKDNQCRKLKLKVGQLTTVSIDRVDKYIGRVNKEILRTIKDFIQLEIVNFIDGKVA